ncbi:MAG TPA: hypothetical protein VMB74_14430 [Streptosporangiaceae bacterium]|nr:hypothetical protein [Streptosporangiaceae bacterium]
MLEESIGKAFQEMADQEQPHSRISIQQALRDGRTRLRRRRLMRAVGTPALAAAAVLAIVLPSGSLPAGSHSDRPQSVVPSVTATARHFSPLAVYASFGWLPAKEPVVPSMRKDYAELNVWGQMEATSETYNDRAWELTAFAVGRCSRLGNHIDCGFGKSHSCDYDAYIQARAPAVNGRQAYWVYDQGTKNYPGMRCLAWEYRPGGWAYLSNAGEINPSKHLTVRIASNVRFGGRQPSFEFAAQIRKLPGKWQVVLPTFFIQWHGPLLAGNYTITDGKTTLSIGINFSSPKHNKCLGAKPVCRVINGYYVTLIKYLPQTRGGQDHYAIWAADADDAFVMIGEVTRKHIGLLYTVFSHMKMLGGVPANWTTKPIS